MTALGQTGISAHAPAAAHTASVSVTSQIAPLPADIGRAHYQDLDFLRGIAAIAVVLYHFSLTTSLPFLCPHGYLAVDLFFVLSGFVVMHAYGHKIGSGRLGIGRFMVIRLLRLMPLIVLGVTLAAIVEFGRPDVQAATHRSELVSAFVRGCLVLPSFGTATLQHTVFPLNGPEWSLFFEIAANGLFAVLLSYNGKWLLAPVIFGAAGLALYLANHATIAQAGVIPSDFAAGFARVAFSFFLGAMLYRVRLPVTVNLGRWFFAGALLVILFVPVLPGSWNALYDGAMIAFVIPCLVLGCAAGNPSPSDSALVRWSSQISYPLYAIHYAFARAIAHLLGTHHASFDARLATVLVSTMCLIVLAALCDVRFDRPLRRRFRTLLLQS